MCDVIDLKLRWGGNESIESKGREKKKSINL